MAVIAETFPIQSHISSPLWCLWCLDLFGPLSYYSAIVHCIIILTHYILLLLLFSSLSLLS